jgi:hypothetical protein
MRFRIASDTREECLSFGDTGLFAAAHSITARAAPESSLIFQAAAPPLFNRGLCLRRLGCGRSHRSYRVA